MPVHLDISAPLISRQPYVVDGLAALKITGNGLLRDGVYLARPLHLNVGLKALAYVCVCPSVSKFMNLPLYIYI